MSRPIILLHLMQWCLLLTSCSSKAIYSDEQAERVRLEAHEMLNQYVADINAEGFIAELKYLDTSAQFSWLPPGFQSPIDYDSVATILRKNAIVFSNVKMIYNSLQVMPSDKETATYFGNVTVITTDTAGRSDTAYLKEKGKLVKRADGWKLVSGKTSIFPNPMSE